MIMLDTNIVIDLLEEDDNWFDWSAGAHARASSRDIVGVSSIVVGELASGRRILPAIISFLEKLNVIIFALDAADAYAAGQAHRAYRQAGGRRDKLLSDFLIGGHALARGASLITRDPRRYRTYLPELSLITPETDHG